MVAEVAVLITSNGVEQKQLLRNSSDHGGVTENEDDLSVTLRGSVGIYGNVTKENEIEVYELREQKDTEIENP